MTPTPDNDNVPAPEPAAAADADQHPAGTIRFESLEAARQQLQVLLGMAQQEVFIASPQLWPELFDHAELVEAIKAFALRSRYAQVRLQVAHTRHWQTDGHRWLPLIQRLPSRFDLRVFQSGYWDRHGFSEHIVCADRALAWCCQSEVPVSGFMHPNDAGRVKLWRGEFEQRVRFTEAPSHLRRLT